MHRKVEENVRTGKEKDEERIKERGGKKKEEDRKRVRQRKTQRQLKYCEKRK